MSFFRGDEKHSPESNVAGFIKQEKELFQKLKSNLETIRISFQKESEDIVKASLQAPTPKQSKQSKQGMQANSVLSRWNDSPLQLLITTTGYNIATNTAFEFSNSAEYLRLKKMFFAADLDFSGETPETRTAIKTFLDTFNEFELWLANREELRRLGSMDPILEDRYADDRAVNNEISKFKARCDKLATDLQESMIEMFTRLNKSPSNAARLDTEIQQAQEKLKASDSQEEYAVLVKVIQAKREERNKDRFQKVSSKFYKLYCDYSNSNVTSAMGPAELAASEMFKEVKLLLLGQGNVSPVDLSAEKTEVKAAALRLRDIVAEFDTRSKDKLFLLAYPAARDALYQPPTPRA